MKTAEPLQRLIILGLITAGLLLFSACPKAPQTGTSDDPVAGAQSGGQEPAAGQPPVADGSQAGSQPGSAAGGSMAADMAKDFAFTAYAGGSHRLSEYKGKPVVLNFWADW